MKFNWREVGVWRERYILGGFHFTSLCVLWNLIPVSRKRMIEISLRSRVFPFLFFSFLFYIRCFLFLFLQIKYLFIYFKQISK
jgi:hypothetical protein